MFVRTVYLNMQKYELCCSLTRKHSSIFYLSPGFYPTILEPAFLLVSTSGDTSPIPNHLSFDSFRLSFQLKDGGTRSLSVTFIIGSIINGQFRCKMFLLIQCAAITGKPRYNSFRILVSLKHLKVS